MLTPDDCKTLFLEVMDRMVEARWLQSHTFTDGKGHHLTWTSAGTERALCLKKIAETFDLSGGDDRPLAFDLVAHGESLAGTPHRLAAPLDATIAAYWRESVAQLGFEPGSAFAATALLRYPKWCSASRLRFSSKIVPF